METVRDILAVIGMFALLPILTHFGEAYGPDWLADACSDFRRYLRWRGGVPERYERPENEIMRRYNPDTGYGPDDQPWVKITEIVVPTDYDKTQLLAALEYLHDGDIDTDYIAVNSLVHLYQNPELIIVRG